MKRIYFIRIISFMFFLFGLNTHSQTQLSIEPSGTNQVQVSWEEIELSTYYDENYDIDKVEYTVLLNGLQLEVPIQKSGNTNSFTYGYNSQIPVLYFSIRTEFFEDENYITSQTLHGAIPTYTPTGFVSPNFITLSRGENSTAIPFLLFPAVTDPDGGNVTYELVMRDERFIYDVSNEEFVVTGRVYPANNDGSVLRFVPNLSSVPSNYLNQLYVMSGHEISLSLVVKSDVDNKVVRGSNYDYCIDYFENSGRVKPTINFSKNVSFPNKKVTLSFGNRDNTANLNADDISIENGKIISLDDINQFQKEIYYQPISPTDNETTYDVNIFIPSNVVSDPCGNTNDEVTFTNKIIPEQPTIARLSSNLNGQLATREFGVKVDFFRYEESSDSNIPQVVKNRTTNQSISASILNIINGKIVRQSINTFYIVPDIPGNDVEISINEAEVPNYLDENGRTLQVEENSPIVVSTEDNFFVNFILTINPREEYSYNYPRGLSGSPVKTIYMNLNGTLPRNLTIEDFELSNCRITNIIKVDDLNYQLKVIPVRPGSNPLFNYSVTIPERTFTDGEVYNDEASVSARIRFDDVDDPTIELIENRIYNTTVNENYNIYGYFYAALLLDYSDKNRVFDGLTGEEFILDNYNRQFIEVSENAILYDVNPNGLLITSDILQGEIEVKIRHPENLVNINGKKIEIEPLIVEIEPVIFKNITDGTDAQGNPNPNMIKVEAIFNHRIDYSEYADRVFRPFDWWGGIPGNDQYHPMHGRVQVITEAPYLHTLVINPLPEVTKVTVNMMKGNRLPHVHIRYGIEPLPDEIIDALTNKTHRIEIDLTSTNNVLARSSALGTSSQNINEIINNEVVVYPNEVLLGNDITLRGAQLENATIELFDTSGRAISRKIISNSTEKNINTFGLKKGVNFIRISKQDGSVETKKIVVK